MALYGFWFITQHNWYIKKNKIRWFIEAVDETKLISNGKIKH